MGIDIGAAFNGARKFMDDHNPATEQGRANIGKDTVKTVGGVTKAVGDVGNAVGNFFSPPAQAPTIFPVKRQPKADSQRPNPQGSYYGDIPQGKKQREFTPERPPVGRNPITKKDGYLPRPGRADSAPLAPGQTRNVVDATGKLVTATGTEGGRTVYTNQLGRQYILPAGAKPSDYKMDARPDKLPTLRLHAQADIAAQNGAVHTTPGGTRFFIGNPDRRGQRTVIEIDKGGQAVEGVKARLYTAAKSNSAIVKRLDSENPDRGSVGNTLVRLKRTEARQSDRVNLVLSQKENDALWVPLGGLLKLGGFPQLENAVNQHNKDIASQQATLGVDGNTTLEKATSFATDVGLAYVGGGVMGKVGTVASLSGKAKFAVQLGVPAMATVGTDAANNELGVGTLQKIAISNAFNLAGRQIPTKTLFGQAVVNTAENVGTQIALGGQITTASLGETLILNIAGGKGARRSMAPSGGAGQPRGKAVPPLSIDVATRNLQTAVAQHRAGRGSVEAVSAARLASVESYKANKSTMSPDQRSKWRDAAAKSDGIIAGVHTDTSPTKASSTPSLKPTPTKPAPQNPKPASTPAAAAIVEPNSATTAKPRPAEPAPVVPKNATSANSSAPVVEPRSSPVVSPSQQQGDGSTRSIVTPAFNPHDPAQLARLPAHLQGLRPDLLNRMMNGADAPVAFISNGLEPAPGSGGARARAAGIESPAAIGAAQAQALASNRARLGERNRASDGFTVVIPAAALATNATRPATNASAVVHSNLTARQLFAEVSKVAPAQRESVIRAAGLSEILETREPREDYTLRFRYEAIPDIAYGKTPEQLDPNTLRPTPSTQTVRDPVPVNHEGRSYDIVGVDTVQGALQLRASSEMDRMLPVRELLPREVGAGAGVQLLGRPAIIDGRRYTIQAVETRTDMPNGISLRPQGRTDPAGDLFLPAYRLSDLRIPFEGANTYRAVGLTANALHLRPEQQTMTNKPLREGDRFEAFVVGNESKGPVRLAYRAGRLTVADATNPHFRPGAAVALNEVASSRVNVRSQRHGGYDPIDEANGSYDRGPVVERMKSSALTDLNRSAAGAVRIGSSSSTPVLNRYEANFRDQATFIDSYVDPVPPRQLTLQNLAYEFTNDKLGRSADPLLQALVRFRARYPTTPIVLYGGGSALKFADKRGTRAQLLTQLRAHNIELRLVAGKSRETVTHAKSISVQAGDGGKDAALLTTGAAFANKDKSDISFRLDDGDAALFNEYQAIASQKNTIGTSAARAQLVGRLAERGVVIQDIHANRPVIRQAISEVIDGAKSNLLVQFSELRMPSVTQRLTDAAARGVDVTIQFRGIDNKSLRALESARRAHPNLRFEFVPDPPGYAHYNTVIADGKKAYVGTAYPWDSMLNTISDPEPSSEVGVVIKDKRVEELLGQIDAAGVADSPNWRKGLDALKRSESPRDPSASPPRSSIASPPEPNAGQGPQSVNLTPKPPLQARLSVFEQQLNARTASILASRQIDSVSPAVEPQNVPVGRVGLRDASFVGGARTVPASGAVSLVASERAVGQLHAANVEVSRAAVVPTRAPQIFRPLSHAAAPVVQSTLRHVDAVVRAVQRAAAPTVTSAVVRGGRPAPSPNESARVFRATADDTLRVGNVPTHAVPQTAAIGKPTPIRIHPHGDPADRHAQFAEEFGLNPGRSTPQILRVLGSPFAPLAKPLAQVSGTIGAALNLGQVAAAPVLRPAKAFVTMGRPVIGAATVAGLGLGYFNNSLKIDSFTMKDAKGLDQVFVARSLNMAPNAHIWYALAGQHDGASALLATSINQGSYFIPAAFLPGQLGVPLQPSMGSGGASLRSSPGAGAGKIELVSQIAYGTDLQATANFGLTGLRSDPGYSMAGAQVQPGGKVGIPFAKYGVQGGPGSAVMATNLYVGPLRLGEATIFSFGSMDFAIGSQGIESSIRPVAVFTIPAFGPNPAWSGGVAKP